MDKKVILGSLAMDLKRAALGFHLGSYAMAQRFLDEAVSRKREYKGKGLKPYMVQILDRVEKLKSQPKEKLAENALTYSTLIQNFVLRG